MSIRFGFAETDITPDGPVSLIGFYREDDTSKGVLKPLMAQAAVWKGEECCALIAIDSIGLTVELTNDIAPKYFCSEETPVDATGPEFIRSENALQLMADEICRSVEETELSDENKGRI